MLNTDFNIIFWFVFGIITLGAATIATLTLINVLRLRNVRLSWKTGKMGGYPLFSTLFLISTFLVMGIAIYRGVMDEMILAALYAWLGFCWFATSYYSAKRFITDHGIVKNVNEPSQTVAWHQIKDLVEYDDKLNGRYIFIYSTDCRPPDEDQKLIRLELEVPEGQKKSFKKLISHKLGRRIRCYINDDTNVQQFD